MSPLLFLLLFSLLLLPPSSSAADLSSDAAALLAFRAAVAPSRFPSWNASAASKPCSWRGVSCSASRVTALRLPGATLAGPIPPSTLGNLTALRTLSLRFNALASPLPSDLAALSQLRSLFLQNNRFSGGFPSFVPSLAALTHLDLSANAFSGQIPASLNSLTRLKTLYLQSNNFSGQIPNLNRLTGLAQFNVSFNSLNGSIPSTFKNQPKSAFLGMHLCGAPLAECPIAVSPTPAFAPSGGGGGGGSGLSGGAIAGIAVGSVVGALLLLAILILLCRKKGASAAAAAPKPPEARSREATAAAAPNGREGSAEVKKLVFLGGGGDKKEEFDLEDLLRASAEVLGKGTFGTAYKAVLEAGLVVAVKRLKDVALSEGEFKEKIEAIGKVDHRNVVPLKAYYYSKDEKLLVYDFMANGSLSASLHGSRGSGRAPLSWETRSAIALSAAKGLAYIHSTSPTFSHGNIKSSNILLGNSHEDARVSDHGLAYLIGAAASSAPARGASSGYRAPEVTDLGRISQKADVYSFGVLLLELLTGKPPSQAALNEEGIDLPRWVKSVVRDEWTSEVFDSELLRLQNVEEEMVQLLTLALECSEQYPDSRPSMSDVVSRIEDILQSKQAADDSIDEVKPQGGD